MVTYPDLFVRCAPLADAAILCDDPVLTVEALSPSTRGEDPVRKRWGCQAIPTLWQLVYIDASRRRVESGTRAEDGSRRSALLERVEASLSLEPLDAMLPLAKVHAGTGMR
jgi:hypothetical protein